MFNILTTPSTSNDAIDFSLKKSVQYHVRKELCGISAYFLDDVEVDDNLGSLSCLSDKISHQPWSVRQLMGVPELYEKRALHQS